MSTEEPVESIPAPAADVAASKPEQPTITTLNGGDALGVDGALKRKRDDEAALGGEEGQDGNGVAVKKPATEATDGTTPAAATQAAPAVNSTAAPTATNPAFSLFSTPTPGGVLGMLAAATGTAGTAAAAGTTGLKEGQVKESVDVPQQLVGRIIGKGGETIRDLMTRSGCEIQIDQNFPEGAPRKIHIIGTAQNVRMAKDMVSTVMEKGPQGLQSFPVLTADNTTVTVECPPHLVGRIIGKGGETIRELQARSRARVQIDQSMPEGVPRKVIIMGDTAAVQLGESMVKSVMEHGPAGMNQVPAQGMFAGAPVGVASAPSADGTQSLVVDCPKNLVGRVIGRGGETIQALQTKTGCKIQIDQNVPDGQPCKITIVSGPAQNMPMAAQLVYDVMNNGPQRLYSMQPLQPSAPYPGGYSQYGAAPQGYGQQYPYGQQAPAPAPYYGQQPPQQQSYGGYPAAPAPAPYGGYDPQHQPSHHQPPPSAYGQPAYGQPAPSPAPAPSAVPYGHGHAPQAPVQPTQQQQPHVPYAQPQQPVAPPPPQPKPISSEWQECKTAEGVSYYYNTVTGVSQWNKP